MLLWNVGQQISLICWFHEALVASCDSPWLLRLRNILFEQPKRCRRISVPLDQIGRDIDSEHKEIADATIARDVSRACSAPGALGKDNSNPDQG